MPIPDTLVQLKLADDILVLSIAAQRLGDVSTVARFERELRALLQTRPEHHWLIDFGNITFFITPTVSLLLELFRTLRARGGRLVLTGLSPDVQYVLGLMRLGEVLTIRPTLQAGLDALRGDSVGADGGGCEAG